jgi:hypothetical protein
VPWANAAAQSSAAVNKVADRVCFIGKSPSFTFFEERRARIRVHYVDAVLAPGVDRESSPDAALVAEIFPFQQDPFNCGISSSNG